MNKLNPDIRSTQSDEQRLVSVIMNCCNGEKYLREAIESVLAQGYKNWEIIFWDNQSIDQSAAIFKSYNDPRMNYFYAPIHTTLYKARNCAIEKAAGDFIAFLDVDDWWEPEKLEKQIPLFEDKEVGLVYGNYWFVNERKKKIKKIALQRHLPEGKVLNQLLKNYPIGMLTMVVRRSAVEGLNRIFDPRYQMIGDFDLAIRLAAEWKLACIQTPVASYRWHGDNRSILDTPLTISEFETWCSEIKHCPVICNQTGLVGIRETIDYLKVMNILSQGKRAKAFSLFLRYPLNFKKLKLLFAIITPLTLLKALRA